MRYNTCLVQVMGFCFGFWIPTMFSVLGTIHLQRVLEVALLLPIHFQFYVINASAFVSVSVWILCASCVCFILSVIYFCRPLVSWRLRHYTKAVNLMSAVYYLHVVAGVWTSQGADTNPWATAHITSRWIHGKCETVGRNVGHQSLYSFTITFIAHTQWDRGMKGSHLRPQVDLHRLLRPPNGTV